MSLFLFLVACSPARKQIETTLGFSEQIMNERPDSALTLLRGLDQIRIGSQALKARAALLHQIALDKCYIDITSDSILSPAIKWYAYHGTAGQKLKVWYYRSVLARNAGDYDLQMKYLVQGERFIVKANDPLMAGRLYTAKQWNFINIYALDEAVCDAEKAVDAFRRAGDNSRYYNAAINLINIYDMQGREDKARPLLDTLLFHWADLSITQQRLTYANALSVERDPKRILSLLEEYLERVPEKEINWTVVAESYLDCNLPYDAEEAIGHAAAGFLRNRAEEIAFYLVRSRVMEAMGRKEEALADYQKYTELREQKIQRGLTSDSRFISEIQTAQEHEKKGRKYMAGLIFLIAIITSLALFLIQRYRQIIQIRRLEAASLMNELALNQDMVEKEKQSAKDAKEEVMRLNELLEKQKSFDKDLWATERIDLLNQITARYLTPNGEKTRKESIENLLQTGNRASISKNLDQQFAYVHPDFCAFLNNKHLTERERICCILLCLGLNGKDISSFLGIKEWTCYNLFAKIRAKLGLKDVKINLSTSLKEKLLQYDNPGL